MKRDRECSLMGKSIPTSEQFWQAHISVPTDVLRDSVKTILLYFPAMWLFDKIVAAKE